MKLAGSLYGDFMFLRKRVNTHATVRQRKFQNGNKLGKDIMLSTNSKKKNFDQEVCVKEKCSREETAYFFLTIMVTSFFLFFGRAIRRE